MDNFNPLQSIPPVEEKPPEKHYFKSAGNPKYYIWGLVIILALLAGYVALAVNQNLWPFQAEEPLLGGDKDIHGCIGSAGYQWCEVKQKCLRIWEEPCSK